MCLNKFVKIAKRFILKNLPDKEQNLKLMYGQNYGKRLINKTVIKCSGPKKNKYSSYGGKVKGVWHHAIKWHVLDKDGATF